MSTLTTVLSEERSRLMRLYELYLKKLADLPRGTLQHKKIKGHDYFYLAYRKPGDRKLYFDYLKQDEIDIDELSKQIEKRRYFESEMRKLKKEMKELEKVVKKNE